MSRLFEETVWLGRTAFKCRGRFFPAEAETNTNAQVEIVGVCCYVYEVGEFLAPEALDALEEKLLEKLV